MANINKGIKLMMPKRTTIPGFGENRLRCKCGNMAFSVMVVPFPPHNITAKASTVVCTRCQKSVPVLSDATIGNYGKKDVISKLHAHHVQQGNKLDAD